MKSNTIAKYTLMSLPPMKRYTKTLHIKKNITDYITTTKTSFGEYNFCQLCAYHDFTQQSIASHIQDNHQI